MGNRLIQVPRNRPPLPIKNGLNPTRVQVAPEYAGISVQDFVWHLIVSQRRRAAEDNEHALAQRFANHEVIVGPRFRVAEPSELLQANEEVWFYRMPFPEDAVPYQCEVIFEDDDLLVVDKPPFLATMPRGKHIINSATVQVRRATGLDELSPAHRLDRLTSGVLVFTKRREVRGAYQTLFSERKASKEYLAVAKASKEISAGTVWEHHIDKKAGAFQATFIDDAPVNAITTMVEQTRLASEVNARLCQAYGLSEDDTLAAYRLKPLTGKTHQLRMHMLRAGVPILGDPVYPKVLPEDAENYDLPMHLTATKLSFEDPFTGEKRTFESARTWMNPVANRIV